MSDSKQPHKDEDPKPETASPREETPEAKEEPKPKYEFKILPADPKNNFDFEDVADK